LATLGFVTAEQVIIVVVLRRLVNCERKKRKIKLLTNFDSPSNAISLGPSVILVVKKADKHRVICHPEKPPNTKKVNYTFKSGAIKTLLQ